MTYSDDDEIFLHGRCHLLALALHELTGLPIGAYLDVDEELGEGSVVLVHAFAIDGEDGIDLRGRLPIDHMLDGEFDAWEPWFTPMSAEELLVLGHGSTERPDGDEEFVVARMLAERIASELGLLTTAATPP